MKVIAWTILSFSLTIVAAPAQDTLKVQPSVSAQERLDQIEIEEIPEVIQEKLAGKEYSSWRLERAYTAPHRSKIKPAKNDSLYYVLELRRGSESIRVWFDEAGNKRDD